jgi:glucose-1-phosphate cytidylyltransferase
MTAVATVILCGGRGTRAYPHTVDLPKPLLQVGDAPVLRHVMEVYAQQGFRTFVLAAGFKAELIETFASSLPAAWDVTVLDTGLDTPTGERIRACRDVVGSTFFATYGDGLGDVDLHDLLEFHRAHGRPATVTAVPLPSQYGTVELGADGSVERFREKPRLDGHLINAGFLVFDATVFDAWVGEDLERDVLPGLAHERGLMAYRHHGFWKSMDTYKDALELTALTEGGRPPWLRQATDERS